MKVQSLAVAALAASSMVDAFSSRTSQRPRNSGGAGSQQFTVSEPEMENQVEKSKETSPPVMDTEKPTEPSVFVNNGPLAWMQQFLDWMGVKPGETIAYGPFTTGPVEESKRTAPEEASQFRQEAARQLQNIGMEERNRRLEASKVMNVLTVVYAVWAALIGDQGDLGGHMLRFATVLPLFLTVGYRLSSETGL